MLNRKRLVRTFLDLVHIDSPSSEEEKVAKELVKRLKALGGKVSTDSYGNVIGKFAGKGEPIMLNAHMDTVEPGRGIKPVVKGDKITSDGTTILGGDQKAGISIILEALTSLLEDKKAHTPIETVFTRQEETGLLGARNLEYTNVSAKRAIVFDGIGQVNTIVISTPYYSSVDVTVIGKAAHAGVEPEKGLSAITIASEILSRLELGRIDEETTANIGLIQGGSVRNAIPEQTHFRGEIRSRNNKKFEKHLAHFQEVVNTIQKRYPQAKILYAAKRELNGYALPSEHHLLRFVTSILESMRIKPNYIHEGGLFDSVIFSANGIEAVVVGTGMYNAHTTREYVLISQMLEAAQFCEKIVTS